MISWCFDLTIGLSPALLLKLYGESLAHMDSYRHLGFTLSSDLSWNAHVGAVVVKVKSIRL